MDADLLLTTCPSPEELDRAVTVLDSMDLAYQRIEPNPALSQVALPVLVMKREVRSRLQTAAPTIIFSGWIDYRAPQAVIPDWPPLEEVGFCFRRAAIMVLGPCVADETRIRLIVHLEGDLGPVLPYLNAVMPHASYTPANEALTFMKEYRMIVLYRHRITIAKADEITDAWLTLESIRRQVEQVWKDRDHIEPSFEIRRKPPALEIFKRLPRTNCRRCGELTCLAFAVRVWTGEASVRLCLPVFENDGGFLRLQEALLEICKGMGAIIGEQG